MLFETSEGRFAYECRKGSLRLLRFRHYRKYEEMGQWKVHVCKLVCVQTFSTRCEDVEDNGDCVRCVKRRHSLKNGREGDLLSNVCVHCPLANKIVAIAHNAKAFDHNFILNMAIMLKWKSDLGMNVLWIMCMKMEQLLFLDGVSFLPCALCKLPTAFFLWTPNRGPTTILTPRNTYPTWDPSLTYYRTTCTR